MPNKTWILLDSITKIQSQPLSTEQLQNAVLKMQERDWTRFYVWTEGWQNWQILKEFLRSEQDTVRVQHDEITQSATLINPNEDMISEPVEQDFDGDHLQPNPSRKTPESLNFKKIGEAYKNRAVRHELKIEILLINQKNKTFRSYSKNISLTGTLLEDNVPFDFYGTQFDVVVVNRNSLNIQNSRVQMRAETIGEGLTQRVRFIGQTEHQKQKLLTLLNDYISQQAHLKKIS